MLQSASSSTIPGECRFLQSIKTFAASALFQGTLIFAKRQTFEDLMEIFLRRLKIYAGDSWPSDVSRIVTGRPVHFAGANPDPALATERYNEALTRFGFPEIHFVYEPVAAAFYFAQNLKADATVLVADFGGGTTDYSIIRFETSGWQAQRDADRPFWRRRCRRSFRLPHDRSDRRAADRQRQFVSKLRQDA